MPNDLYRRFWGLYVRRPRPPCLEVPSIIHVLPDDLPRGSVPRLLP